MRCNDQGGLFLKLLHMTAFRAAAAAAAVAAAAFPGRQAEMFQKKGKALRNKMWWNYCKWKLLIVLCLLILAVIIFLAACFSGGRDCTQQDVREKVEIHASGGGAPQNPEN